MTIFCVAYVGKANEPLYYYCKEDTSEYLHLQMIVHGCLDIVEERKKRAVLSTASFEMYLGQLFPIEDYRTFGCYTNTHNKIIVVCDNTTTDTGGIKETIFSLNNAFVNALQNPFQPVAAPLLTRTLDVTIHTIVQQHNSLAKRKN